MKVQGTYQDIEWFGSYELAWIIWNIEVRKRLPVRCRETFEYKFNKKIHKYTPDFVHKNYYIEIKGKVKKADYEKWRQFPKDLKVLFKKDLEEQIGYCKNKFGEEFWKQFIGL